MCLVHGVINVHHHHHIIRTGQWSDTESVRDQRRYTCKAFSAECNMSNAEIQGEGSESEEENETNQQFLGSTNVQSDVNSTSGHGIIIAGEASESDDDEPIHIQSVQPIQSRYRHDG